jgi:hypothetical protein
VLYLLLVLVLGTLIYVGWGGALSQVTPHKRRGVGPDDDPEFLWRLSHGDNNPR